MLCELQEELRALAEPKFRKFTTQLMPATQREIVGVRIPQLRNMAKDMARNTDWRAWADSPAENDTFEEVMLRGLVLGYAKMEREETSSRLAAFVPLIDDWAQCDVVCSTLKRIKLWKEDFWNFAQTYLNSRKEFEQRFGYVLLMDYYLDDDYIDRVLKALGAARPTRYYAQMGLAWSLATAFVKYPEPTGQLIFSPNFPKEYKKRTFQKILESRRTTPEQRSEIKQLRELLKNDLP